MSVIGIVCEYNPFHKGHEYQLQQAMSAVGADHVVCVMSGNFLQRGVPALADKYSRAGIAISCGADVVFEIPYVYAASSARDYASAAVRLLDGLGAADYISFGAETDDIGLLQNIAHLTLHEPEQVSADIKSYAAQGYTFAAARARALADYMGGDGITDVLASPNNILAIEYLRAIEEIGSSLSPVLIPRAFAGYSDEKAEHDICSASAIRSLLQSGDMEGIERHVPPACYRALCDMYGKIFPIYEDSLSCLLNSRRLLDDGKDFRHILDMDDELANRLSKLDVHMSFSDTAMKLKTKNCTLTHVQRALLHMITGLRRDEYEIFKKGGWIYYVKLLGMRRSSGRLVAEIKSQSHFPIITKSTEIRHTSELAQRMFTHDVKASRIYGNLVYNAYGNEIPDDYRRSVIVR